MVEKQIARAHLPLNAKHLTHPIYRADIDGLRAVAVLAVVGFHAFPSWVSGGFIGVDVFFVISGYLISKIIFSSLLQNSFDFVEFYSRRIKRIFPALLLVLITCYFLGWFALLADEYAQLGKHIAGGAGFVSNFVFLDESGYFDNAPETKPLLHLWSLGVEEQFYILWPFFLWLAWRASAPRATISGEIVLWEKKLNLLAITIGIAVISFVLSILAVRVNAVYAFYSPQTRFWELLAGSGLAYISLEGGGADKWKHLRVRAMLQRVHPSTLSALGIALIGIAILIITREKEFPGWWAILPICGAVLVIAAGETAWVNRVVLSNRILVWIGLISFPLYLWHWPLLSFAYIMEGAMPSGEIRSIAVLFAVVFAWLTYEFLEKPIRFGKKSRSKIAGLMLLMIAIGIVGYLTYKHDGLESRQVVLNNFDPNQHIQAQFNPPSSCVVDKKEYPLANKFCTKFVAENARKTIVLWGDSSITAWQSVFLDVAKSESYTLIRISHPSCPPILEARKTHFDFPESRNYCADGKLQREVVRLIRAQHPDLTVVISAWNFYSPNSGREYLTDKEGEEANPTTTQRTIARRIPETVSELEEISNLIVFRSWPILTKPPVYEISRIPFLQRKTQVALVDAIEFNKDNEYINAVFDSVTATRTMFFNPAERICTDKCIYIMNRTKLYADEYHVTPQGSMQFRNEIEELLLY